MPSYINGIDASLITGLGQIGVGGGSPTPAPTVYPTGGLIANSGAPNGDTYDGSVNTIWGLNGLSGSAPSWYNRPKYGTGASSASVWTKIVGNANAVYCLSSSGELYSTALNYLYAGRGSAGFVPGILEKITAVTPTASWTDITSARTCFIGINNGYLWGTGAPSNGEYGSGSNSFSDFGNWRQISQNNGWVRVEATYEHTCFMSGSTKASGSVWISGTNNTGRTGMNTATGITTNRAEPFGKTGSIWTDMDAGYQNTYLISASGEFFGTGVNSSRQLGDNTTTQRNAFGAAIATAGFTPAKVYSFNNHGRIITIEGYSLYTGTQTYARGDGSTTAITLWTRLHTASAEFSASWSNFYSPRFITNYAGQIGICNNRPYYLTNGAGRYSAVYPVSNKPYQSASYLRGLNIVTSWTPFFSGSYGSNLNITCSAAAYTTYNSDVSIDQHALWMYLEPQ
jgi:hypothetical protein